MKNKNFAAMLALFAIAPSLPAATLYSCPTGGGGDQVGRGFYVTNYPGSTLDTVTVAYFGGSGDGAYVVSLTPRVSSFGGTVVGATQTLTINISSGVGTGVFNFGGAAVPSGSTVTFKQVLVSGPVASPVLFFDYGTGALGDIAANTCPNMRETEGTTPPLDLDRRASVGVTITGSAALASAPVGAPALSSVGMALLAALVAALAWSGAGFRRITKRRG